jgi:chromosome segregation ATPase
VKIDLRDLISALAVLVAAASMLIVSRNARRATSVQTQSTDLTRIRDLRMELRETKDDLDRCKTQVTQLSRQLTEASDAALESYRERMEMVRYAAIPGMDMSQWRARFDPPKPPAALDHSGA